ncbi:MAG: type II glyceraldehyde-3-phosphate dehydrogenase [Candidatus Aenigmarchaeota archaeon]|nr:type II glyceraldehyde-3-phosphate dehydrogenase [Candidatus Aenigmarchaeota archaeon]
MNICVNGYGTIGKRVAEALSAHPKLRLVGASKYTPDQDARLANIKGIRLFVPSESIKNFESKGIAVSGSVDDMIAQADLVIDASSDGKGLANKNGVYLPRSKPALFQGGESEDIAEMSFNARSNFDAAKGKRYVRVVSCNTTAYCRLLKPLAEHYTIKHVDAFLIRRGADPNDAKGSALNAVEWKAKSHHAHDVQTVIPAISIASTAFKVPHTIAHINSMSIQFDEVPSKDAIAELFSKESRVAMLNSATTSAQIMEAARDIGVKRYDTYAVSLLMNTLQVNGNSAFMSFFVPQESIVVPENVDAVCAHFGMGKQESMKITDDLLGIGRIKKELEAVFA